MRDGQKFKMQYLIKIIHLFKKTNIIKDLPVKEGNFYFNWTNTSHMQGYDENGNKIEDGLKKYSGTPKAVASSGKITENYTDSYVNYKCYEQCNLYSL